jgi:hypothetical protein
MKIINQIDPNIWTHKFSCKKCLAELEANVDDIEYHFSEGDGPHPSTHNYIVSCPICGAKYTLNTFDLKIPEVVLIKARQKYLKNNDPY